MPTKVEVERELARTKDEVILLRGKLEDFRTQVRDKAIEVANEQGWCSAGLNETLEELDLPKVPSSYKRTSLIRVTHAWENDDDAQGEEPGIDTVSIGTHKYGVYLETTDFEVVELGELVEVFNE